MAGGSRSTKPGLGPRAGEGVAVAAGIEAAVVAAATGVAVATAAITDPPGRDSSQQAEPPWRWPRAAYIHIPFCARKCGYCDFASLAGADGAADRYLSALAREIELHLDAPQEVDTIFVGGGTPTRLDCPQLSRLMSIIHEWFVVASGGEWTVEANPGTLDSEKIEILRSAGVNRISLGAQSFQPAVLAVLDRDHGRSEVERAVELVRPAFPRWSLDLIFGVPGSSLEMWRDDVETALALGPSHLSCYGLVFEKGTPLWREWQNGRVNPLDEEVERAMYEATIDRLLAAGLSMYEISNFARSGHECRHNLVYWANDAYFGFGLGAARYIRGARSVNTRDLNGYLRRIEAGMPATGPQETLPAEAMARETAVLNLRRVALGIDRRRFRERTGYDLDDLAGPTLARFRHSHHLDDDGQSVRLSREGLFIADYVFRELL
jgi:oxygen-independent coproporphyrinogen-3 oxidase